MQVQNKQPERVALALYLPGLNAGVSREDNPMKSETVDAIDVTMAAVGTKATYTGIGVSGLGWFLSNEFFGLAGIMIGLAGLMITWYYKHKADKRHTREHDLRIEMLRRGRKPDTDLGELWADE